MTDKEIISNEEFIDAVKAAIEICSLEDFCELCRLSRTSIPRWLSGKNLPVQAMRRPFVSFVNRLKEEHLFNRFISNKEFVESIKSLSDICSLEEFADKHLLSRTSINQWFIGKGLPVQGMRLPIINAINKLKDGVI